MNSSRTKPKPNVILDLDNTLISAEALTDFPFTEQGMREKALKFPIHDMDGYYIVFERPHLQSFLDHLFKNYNVSIWTAATKDYALFIIKHIILKKPNRNLQFIMFSYHCDISKKLFKNSKDLRLIWNIFKLPGFTSDNSLIIDDLREVYDTQPQNAIHIKAFEILESDSETDDQLMEIIPEYIKRVFQKTSAYQYEIDSD